MAGDSGCQPAGSCAAGLEVTETISAAAAAMTRSAVPPAEINGRLMPVGVASHQDRRDIGR